MSEVDLSEVDLFKDLCKYWDRRHMSIPEKCGHGVQLRGPNPPRCIGCEIVWAEQVLFLAERQVKEQKKRLEDLRAEAATTQPVSERAVPTPTGEAQDDE